MAIQAWNQNFDETPSPIRQYQEKLHESNQKMSPRDAIFQYEMHKNAFATWNSLGEFTGPLQTPSWINGEPLHGPGAKVEPPFENCVYGPAKPASCQVTHRCLVLACTLADWLQWQFNSQSRLWQLWLGWVQILLFVRLIHDSMRWHWHWVVVHTSSWRWSCRVFSSRSSIISHILTITLTFSFTIIFIIIAIIITLCSK